MLKNSNWYYIYTVYYLCVVMCPVLANGKIQCQGSSDSQGYYQDYCTFSCNTDDFKLQGPDSGTCLANQSWSGGNPQCVAGLSITLKPLQIDFLM